MDRTATIIKFFDKDLPTAAGFLSTAVVGRFSAANRACFDLKWELNKKNRARGRTFMFRVPSQHNALGFVLLYAKLPQHSPFGMLWT